MPNSPQIIIQQVDIEEILHRVHQHGYSGPVKIIDTGRTFTIRDVQDGFITEILKTDYSPEDFG